MPHLPTTRRSKQRAKRALTTGFFAALAVLASCGGIPPALPGGTSLNPQPATGHRPPEAIRVGLPRPLDPASVPGSIEVARDGCPVGFEYSLEDDGYLLVLSPQTEWPRGETVTIRLGTEAGGLRLLGGDLIPRIELTYFVEDRAQ